MSIESRWVEKRRVRTSRSLTFAKLELVQNGRFTGSIETHHKDAHLPLAELCIGRERETIMVRQTAGYRLIRANDRNRSSVPTAT